MSFFPDLAQRAEVKDLRFLVIGGLAVNFYGYSRETADVDLLICRDSKLGWMDLLGEMGLRMEHDGGTFIQLAPPAPIAWPVDLMLVKSESFHPMLGAARDVDMYGAMVKIPSLDHLIALKLHALKHTRIHRFLKDFQDVEGLIRVGGLDPRSERVTQLFLKYGTLDLHEKIIRACSNE